MLLDYLGDVLEHALHLERFRRAEERKGDDGQSVAQLGYRRSGLNEACDLDRN